MHKALKRKIWETVANRMEKDLCLRSTDKSPRWKLYRSQGQGRFFVVAEAYAVGAGGMKLFPGQMISAFPKAGDVPCRQTGDLVQARGYRYFGDDAMAGLVPYCQVDLLSDWLAPSPQLIERARETGVGSSLLTRLGVTSTERHGLISHGIIEALGVTVPDEEFDSIVEKFSCALRTTLDRDLRPLLEKMNA